MPIVYFLPDKETATPVKPMDVERLLRSLGVTGKLAGFGYAVYMIECVLEDAARIQLITKRLYSETAKRFDVSVNSVERDMRTLIRACWRYPDHSVLDYVAGTALLRPPTNSEFVDIVAGFLRETD